MCMYYAVGVVFVLLATTIFEYDPLAIIPLKQPLPPTPSPHTQLSHSLLHELIRTNHSASSLFILAFTQLNLILVVYCSYLYTSFISSLHPYCIRSPRRSCDGGERSLDLSLASLCRSCSLKSRGRSHSYLCLMHNHTLQSNLSQQPSLAPRSLLRNNSQPNTARSNRHCQPSHLALCTCMHHHPLHKQAVPITGTKRTKRTVSPTPTNQSNNTTLPSLPHRPSASTTLHPICFHLLSHPNLFIQHYHHPSSVVSLLNLH